MKRLTWTLLTPLVVTLAFTCPDRGANRAGFKASLGIPVALPETPHSGNTPSAKPPSG